MARNAAADTRYLEKKNGKWRVVVAVPRRLQPKLGTKLKRELRTDSLSLANQMKWHVVAELRAEIGAAKGKTATAFPLREAIELAKLRNRAATPEEEQALGDVIVDRAEEIAGKPIGHDPDQGEYYAPGRAEQATEFADIAFGRAIPIELHHSDYLKSLVVKARTKADDERALKYLLQWCQNARVRPILQAITRKVAVRFTDEIGSVAGGQSPVTLQKYVNRLSRYWQWLLKREHVAANCWAGLKLPVKQTPHNERERPFTDEEVKRLLSGPASPAMHDLMRIAALTGARLDAIVDLRIGNCRSGLFVFKPQKRETAARAVPVHTDLVEIIERRTSGKPDDADLFPEWPASKRVGSQRERSFKASNVFTAYRRCVGVDEVVVGRRRALVNFHSFRRWFITKAEQADQPEHIIAVVVGHKRQGMTLGRYSSGPLMEQARRCVESVRLPICCAATSD